MKTLLCREIRGVSNGGVKGDTKSNATIVLPKDKEQAGRQDRDPVAVYSKEALCLKRDQQGEKQSAPPMTGRRVTQMQQ